MNKMKKTLILIGGGGHCRACIDVIESSEIFHIAGIVDLPDRINQRISGYGVVGCDEDLPDLVNKYKNVLITLGQIENYNKRIKFFKQIKELGGSLPVIISQFAYVSQNASVDEGTIVMHHAMINAGAKVGRNCIINSKALVEHDTIIEDTCHISTGAIINGGCKILKNTFIGSRAIVKEGVTIGKNSIVGAGSVVINDVPEKSLVFGVPARCFKKGGVVKEE